jgi:amidase
VAIPNNRRTFLKTGALSALGVPALSRCLRAEARDLGFDPSFGTASQAVRAIRSGAISSHELVQHTFQRIKRHNPKINAFVTLIEEHALLRAKEADDALARGQTWGPLHGLPILIKDTFATAGVVTTYGSKEFKNFVPNQDSLAVSRLKQAGAIIIGKTNTPPFGGDHQTFNEVAGTTNNPWDLRRTPGGSTGGGAAALAAGLGFLELGSDMGGSIRSPAHFCGLFGHKTTFGVVPRSGPSLPGASPRAIDNLWVIGPLARSSQDLLLQLDLIGGPEPPEALAYRWSLPAPRGTRLKDYRLGYMVTDPFCPPTGEVLDLLQRAVDELRRHGAELQPGWPPGIDPQKMFDDYFFLLLNANHQRAEERRELCESRRGLEDDYSVKIREALSTPHVEWAVRDASRLRARATWQAHFRDQDAFLMPAHFVPAFAHAHLPSWRERKIDTPEGKREYSDVLRWVSIPTLTGCPATIVPVGLTKQGLPVGLQIMGPFLEDGTTISLAGLIADVLGGFQPPPGYA